MEAGLNQLQLELQEEKVFSQNFVSQVWQFTAFQRLLSSGQAYDLVSLEL